MPSRTYTPFIDDSPASGRRACPALRHPGAVYAAGYVRLTRAFMLETMGEDYIRTARAKGLRERARSSDAHGLRAALTPIVTVAGLDLGGLLGGAIITETVFNYNGLGKLAVQAVTDVRPADHRRVGARRGASS